MTVSVVLSVVSRMSNDRQWSVNSCSVCWQLIRTTSLTHAEYSDHASIAMLCQSDAQLDDDTVKYFVHIPSSHHPHEILSHPHLRLSACILSWFFFIPDHFFWFCTLFFCAQYFVWYFCTEPIKTSVQQVLQLDVSEHFSVECLYRKTSLPYARYYSEIFPVLR